MNEIDFHCHLDMKEFDDSRKEIVSACFNSGFSKLTTVADAYEVRSLDITKEILEYNENIFCTVGGHPHNANQYDELVEKRLLHFYEQHQQRTVAIGEIGLDYHYNFSTPENQVRAFKRQIALAKELELPLVIHSRKAENVTLKILEETSFTLPVVFHCYTGSMEDAQEILKRKYYISISGIVTFKNSAFLRDIVQVIPLDQLFTETDSPYLSPVPFRGKVNNPGRVSLVVEKIAEVKGISTETLNAAVNNNFNRFAGIN